ncbi:MAG: DUF6209 family protein [Sandaracinaceae bacterium]
MTQDRRFALVFLVLALSIGCAAEGAAPPSIGQLPSGLEAAFSTITFDADFAETVTGPLSPGRVLAIDYDPARMPCGGGLAGGGPAWTITMHWRVDGGDVTAQPILGHEPAPGTNRRELVLPEGSELEVWFESTSAFGCHAWDSDFGANYRFALDDAADAPGWMGNEAYVLSRATCDGGGPCDMDRHPLTDGFRYDTGVRQRSLVRALYFDVWKEGVTDFDNPELWRQLDVRVHYRFADDADWAFDYVDFFRRVGHDARYEVPLRELDPLGGNTRTTPDSCPDVPLVRDPSGQYVVTTMRYFFTVNGFPLTDEAGEPFSGEYQDYAGLYAPCDVR